MGASIWSVDWRAVFAIDTPVPEIVVRGTIIYLALFFLLRIAFKREAGAIGITNLLVVVLLADAVQNAMAGGYGSVTDGLLLVLTIVAWSVTLDWVGFRFPRMGRLLHPAPLPLIRNGRILRRNLRRELLTEDELLSHLRQQGIGDPAAVKEAFMESDGRISVVRRTPDAPGSPGPRRG